MVTKWNLRVGECTDVSKIIFGVRRGVLSYRNVLVGTVQGVPKFSRPVGPGSGLVAVGLEGLKERVHGGAVGGDGVDETVRRVGE